MDITISYAAKLLGNRIIQGVTSYTYAVTQRPDLQAQIDAYLIEKEYGFLIGT